MPAPMSVVPNHNERPEGCTAKACWGNLELLQKEPKPRYNEAESPIKSRPTPCDSMPGAFVRQPDALYLITTAQVNPLGFVSPASVGPKSPTSPFSQILDRPITYWHVLSFQRHSGFRFRLPLAHLVFPAPNPDPASFLAQLLPRREIHSPPRPQRPIFGDRFTFFQNSMSLIYRHILAWNVPARPPILLQLWRRLFNIQV